MLLYVLIYMLLPQGPSTIIPTSRLSILLAYTQVELTTEMCYEMISMRSVLNNIQSTSMPRSSSTSPSNNSSSSHRLSLVACEEDEEWVKVAMVDE